jgi:predicted secreted hydrolase
MKVSRRLAVLILLGALHAIFGHGHLAADNGFSQITGPCRQSFPADHAPHTDYRTEWWYYTGNLTDTAGRAFGFQLTFFQSRLKPPHARQRWPERVSAWRTDQIYLAHAAISDIQGGRHLQAEKMARPVLDLAGTRTNAAEVVIRLQGWQVVISPRGHRLLADNDEFRLDLELQAVKPPALHGEQGYSRKGRSSERASCYYSFTRLEAAGTIAIDGTRREVTGTAWMDHEFSSAPLEPGITGWDWFSLQLSDQTELMLYLLRDQDGGVNPASSGSYVLPTGQVAHLGQADVRVAPLSYWTSPHTGARYPIAWRVTIKSLGLNLAVTANLADQEMRTPNSTQVTYWEGSVNVRGAKGEQSIEGVGYVELTGYAQPFDAPM